MADILSLGLIVVVVPLLMIAAISFGLHYFIALSAPPSRRAAWTVGIAYLATAAILIFGGIQEYAAYAPLAAVPGGLAVFWFWRRDFRRGWIEDAEALPDGVTIANDDWRLGLLQLLALMTLAIGAGLIRVLARGL